MSQQWEIEITVRDNDNFAPKQRMKYAVPFAIKPDAKDWSYRLTQSREGIFVDEDMTMYLNGAAQADSVYHLGSVAKAAEIQLGAEDELAFGKSRLRILRIYEGNQRTVMFPRNSDANDLCRICQESACKTDPLLSLCRCKGDTKCVHLSCLRGWLRVPEHLTENFAAFKLHPRALMCEICKSLYASNPAVYLPDLFADNFSTLPIALVRVTSKKAPPAHYLVNLSRSACIGRSPTADIPVNDDLLNLLHCRLQYYDGIVYVKDLKSATGTFLSCRSSMRLSTTACTTLRFKNTTLEILPRRISY